MELYPMNGDWAGVGSGIDGSVEAWVAASCAARARIVSCNARMSERCWPPLDVLDLLPFSDAEVACCRCCAWFGCAWLCCGLLRHMVAECFVVAIERY